MDSESKSTAAAMWFRVISWIASGYFLLGFAVVVGFPPQSELVQAQWPLLVAGILFFALPVFEKIKVPGIIELSRELKRTKKEVEKSREDLRYHISQLSNQIATSSSRASANLYMGGSSEALRQEREEMDEEDRVSGRSTVDLADQIRDEIYAGRDDDTVLALARMRFVIEDYTRKIVLKMASNGDVDEDVSRLSLHRLFAIASKKYPSVRRMESSFRLVVEVCNAALHGREVLPAQYDEAMQLGARVMAKLRNIAED